MDHKAYILAVSRLVEPQISAALRKKYADDVDLSEVKAPFNNFLNDDFLSLLYFSKVDHLMKVNPEIAKVKVALGRITDSGPLLSRMRPVLFPTPTLERSDRIAIGLLRDLDTAWGLPPGTLELALSELQASKGLLPREMRQRIHSLFISRLNGAPHHLH